MTVTLDDVPLNRFHLRVTAYSTGGMFCDGYILGIVGVALAVWTPQVGLSPLWNGLIGASALIGIFLGALVFGWLTDRVGRQTMYTVDLVAFIVASAAQFFVQQPWQLFALRLVMGIAVGADYAIGAALLSEFLPRKSRGPLLACLNGIWTVGYVVAYVVGYLMRDALGSDSWRWMLASSAVPAVIVLCLRLGTPESSRWLADRGRVDEARAIVTKYFGAHVAVPRPGPVSRSSVRDLFAPQWRKRTAFASLFWFAQVLPFFALFTFAPQVLSALGIRSEFAGGLLLNVFQAVGGVVGVLTMNLLPRRTYLIVSFVVLAASLGLLAVLPSPAPVVVLVCFAVFAFVVSAAGNLETVYPSELFATHLRATGVGFAASMSRIGAAVGTFLLPLSLAHLGTRLSMLFGALVLLLGLVVSVAWAPETRRTPLDDTYQPAEPGLAVESA